MITRILRPDIEQGTEEWLKWRTLGSSDLPVLLEGCHFGKDITQLWLEKCGFAESSFSPNHHVERGVRCEPIAREMFESIAGLKYEPMCMEVEEHEFLRVSLDGWNEETNTIIEIKAPADKGFADFLRTRKIKPEYLVQMQYQMLVSGAKFGFYVVYDETSHRIEYEMIPADFGMQLRIFEAADRFWNCVKAQIPPVFDENGQLPVGVPVGRPVLIVAGDRSQFERYTSQLHVRWQAADNLKNYILWKNSLDSPTKTVLIAYDYDTTGLAPVADIIVPPDIDFSAPDFFDKLYYQLARGDKFYA